jgi:hypothetical protein
MVVMMMTLVMMMVMMIVSVEQRPGWTEHILPYFGAILVPSAGAHC